MTAAADRTARFERLYATTFPEIAGYVRRRCGGAEADDVLAQVFTVAWRRLDHIPSPPKDRLWMFGVARKTLADAERSARRRRRLSVRLATEALVSSQANRSPYPAAERVTAALATLRPADREALQLVLWDALSHAEAAVAVIAAVTVSQLLPGSSSGHAPATKRGDVLTALAGVAARQPAVRPPGPGQYQYTDSVSRALGEEGYRRPFWLTYLQTRQIWIGWNGSGRIAEATSDPRFATPHDRAVWIADGRPHLPAGGTFDQRFGRHGLTLGPVNEWKLPTNPARLGALLRKRAIEGGPPGPREDFVQVGDLLRETGAPPALRAALFKVAASIPGVRVLGRITDRLGRTGIVVAYLERPPAGKFRGMYGLDELIFAPKTSALLDEQTVLVDTKAHTRRVTSWTAYVATGVVDSVTAVAPPYARTAASTKPA